jgi:hypothetical protein
VEGAIGERAAEKPIEQAAGRSGGVYVPPFKLSQPMRDVKGKSSAIYQRMTWDALRKSINAAINKVNAANIKNILINYMIKKYICKKIEPITTYCKL